MPVSLILLILSNIILLYGIYTGLLHIGEVVFLYWVETVIDARQHVQERKKFRTTVLQTQSIPVTTTVS